MVKFIMKCDCGKEAEMSINNIENNEEIRVDECLTGSTFTCKKCGKKYHTADWRECFALTEKEF